MSEENIDIKICEDPNAEVEYKFKISVVGDPYVGKTNLIQRFMNNTFIKDSKPTYQATFTSKKFIINKEISHLKYWKYLVIDTKLTGIPNLNLLEEYYYYTIQLIEVLLIGSNESIQKLKREQGMMS